MLLQQSKIGNDENDITFVHDLSSFYKRLRRIQEIVILQYFIIFSIFRQTMALPINQCARDKCKNCGKTCKISKRLRRIQEVLFSFSLNSLSFSFFFFFRADASRISWEKLKINLVHNSERSTSNWHLIEGLSLHESVFDVPRGRPFVILNMITWCCICIPVEIPPSVKQNSGSCLSMFPIRLM